MSVTLRELERLKRRRRLLGALAVGCTIGGALSLAVGVDHRSFALAAIGVVAVLAAVYAMVVVVETGR